MEHPLQRHDLTKTLPAVRDILRHDLDMWREVQLNYYYHTDDQKRWYAPILRF